MYLRKKTTSLSSVKFGAEIREKEFYLDSDIVHCNHGSYGTVPRRVLAVKQRFEVDAEKCPDAFILNHTSVHYNAARAAVAQFVGSNKENIVFVENVTTAINAVLKRIQLVAGDSILITNLTYPSTTYTANDVCQVQNGINIVILEIEFPINSEFEIIEQYKEILSANPSIRIAIIDHITSSTALVLPVKNLIELCHQHSVQVLVDGAHAPGQIQLNLEQLAADYYTGSLYKWVFSARGCAFLWVHPRHQNRIKPLVTSHNYKMDFQKVFYIQGARDDSTYLSAASAIQFYKEIGGL
ncbi:uncharacterized protein LOC102802809, partial [Saccoglossus kowalevskii]|uniref:Uncharacterized aminotransferase C660.12c-like n=1 Tax=Saccoglossus kowalevskii TaxID=10224 RepID=A0ABM0MVP1_SACKO